MQVGRRAPALATVLVPGCGAAHAPRATPPPAGEAPVSATREPAEFLGREDELGTIEVGKRADLLILRGNPLENIRRTREIEAVVMDGRLLDREELDAILARIEGRVRPGP